jgi:hypothetical protein
MKINATSVIAPICFRGGVCHGATEEKTYVQLCALVREEIEELRKAGKEIPVPATRAMREAVLA